MTPHVLAPLPSLYYSYAEQLRGVCDTYFWGHSLAGSDLTCVRSTAIALLGPCTLADWRAQPCQALALTPHGLQPAYSMCGHQEPPCLTGSWSPFQLTPCLYPLHIFLTLCVSWACWYSSAFGSSDHVPNKSKVAPQPMNCWLLCVPYDSPVTDLPDLREADTTSSRVLWGQLAATPNGSFWCSAGVCCIVLELQLGHCPLGYLKWFNISLALTKLFFMKIKPFCKTFSNLFRLKLHQNFARVHHPVYPYS